MFTKMFLIIKHQDIIFSDLVLYIMLHNAFYASCIYENHFLYFFMHRLFKYQNRLSRNITTMHNKIEINQGINNKENAIRQKITTPRIYIYHEILLKKRITITSKNILQNVSDN